LANVAEVLAMEQKEADELPTSIAESGINEEGASEEGNEGEEQ
jgi:hypothetical protein